jgi:hypothetical protein
VLGRVSNIMGVVDIGNSAKYLKCHENDTELASFSRISVFCAS